MRTAFIKRLIEEARMDESVFLVVGDLGFSVVEPFADEFPERFLNPGVAEQNMTGIAAGLALEGYTVFTYSIGNFPTLRCMEQIRYDVCYHKLNVKIVSVGGGYAYGPLGASHHATEEIGMLRTIPNLVVCAPGDPAETTAVTSAISKHKGPCYMRLGKAGEPTVHKTKVDLEIGDIVPVIDGEETAVLCTGAMLKYAADFIRDGKLPWSLYSLPFIKPMDKSSLGTVAKRHGTLITLEEHQLSGGFGSAVLEVLNDLHADGTLMSVPKVRRIGVPDNFMEVAGSQTFLRKQAGIKLDDVERLV